MQQIDTKQKSSNSTFLLLVSVFVVATCGLIYELVAGTLASYLLGDSVTQFSTIIGVYLFSMGIGSYFSKFLKFNLVEYFISTEILIGLIGGLSSTVLLLIFNWVQYFQVVLYFFVGITGALVGLEIPLLMRILQKEFEFSDLVSRVFTFDYIGALIASILFPLLLIPHLGLLRTSLFFGLLNIGIALWVALIFKENRPKISHLIKVGFIGLVVLLVGFVNAENLNSFAESEAYQNDIIFAKSTHYQRIVVTQIKSSTKLFLNGNLQFNSTDEYRYHEALVHPIMSSLKNATNILVLGGGDGMAVREILKYSRVNKITLVDLDPDMTDLFTNNSMLVQLNDSSFHNPKVTVINADAFIWLKKTSEKFDAIIIDFPDPANFSLGKLYSSTFYNQISNNLSDSGAMVIQSTSPLVAPKSFWCINKTLNYCRFSTLPYHAFVPSFGEWGYILAFKSPDFKIRYDFPDGLRFITPEVMQDLFSFPEDMKSVDTEINKLDNQVLVNYFDEEWSDYVQ